ncbi:MAG: DNA-binding transcriptional LysR family regulator [Parasphingorhabdus sp.]|jgi:DNA-binding transcriptional LysR family regulator
MPLPLRQLEAFHAVVVNGSMTKAATSLNISQPAVSRLVASLEAAVGFQLFKRLSGRLRPTPEAGYLFDEVEKALANLNHISRLTENLQDLKKGHLRVACLPGFATSLLPRVLARFLKERPGLTLTLEPRAPERIQEWISARQFDVGLSESFEQNPAIESETLLVRTVCVIPKGHKLAEKKVIKARDLHDTPLILTYRDHKIYLELQERFRADGVELRGIVETRQFATACIMVSEGLGAAIVSEIDAMEFASADLVVLPFEPVIPFEINILFPAYMPRSIATLEFVEAFKLAMQPFCI